jgi:threonine/homoserine/homoserine lactone efflux protein
MIEVSWLLFVVASLVLIVTPGQAGLLSAWLRSRPRVLGWLHRTSGAVLIGLGLKLAFERRT